MDSVYSEAVVVYFNPAVLSPESMFTERLNMYFTRPRYLSNEVI